MERDGIRSQIKLDSPLRFRSFEDTFPRPPISIRIERNERDGIPLPVSHPLIFLETKNYLLGRIPTAIHNSVTYV